MSCYALTRITCLRKKLGHSQGNVIVKITMSKLNLTLIQHILGIMQETLPVLSRVDANLNMQYKAVLQSAHFFSATDK